MTLEQRRMVTDGEQSITFRVAEPQCRVSEMNTTCVSTVLQLKKKKAIDPVPRKNTPKHNLIQDSRRLEDLEVRGSQIRLLYLLPL